MKKLLLSTTILLIGILSFSQTRVSQYKSKDQILNEQYCNGLFKSYEGTYFDLVDDNRTLGAQTYRNILDWLNGRVAGLQVFITRTGERIPIIRNSRAGIFVDEIPVSPDFLNSLSTNDIGMIKIIKGPFLGGFNCPGGAVAIYTIHAEDEEEGED
jgi:hypothetical protein